MVPANTYFHKVLTLLLLAALIFPVPVQQAQAPAILSSTFPVVAIHVSELTRALEKMPAAGTDTPQPPGTPDATGYQWFYTSWHYFVIYESLIEALRSDGTPFVTISDADIGAGGLLQSDGSPKYPILISLAAEAVGDDEIDPLRKYVNAGGFLMAGSSAFTRYPDGATRRDFALADEMGIHMANANLQNWYSNQVFSKVIDHRLVSHIPWGSLSWKMPLSSEEIPWGTSYFGHPLNGAHYDFKVRITDATLIAKGSNYPLLATRNYGKGVFIYHSDMQPLIGFGGPDSGMYAYGIYRNAIQWAFEADGLPLIKLSPWRYPYDAAFILRHDLENTAGQLIESSAKAEFEAGAKGDYYFCTGVLRDQMKNDPILIASLRRAVSLYGATIGPHNGGLKNPNNYSLTYSNFDYWHWGPDEALNGTPTGYEYAKKSLTIAYQDIERWLAGVDNGRPGCGTAGDCPRIWVSPYFNSTREDSIDILSKLNVITMGEQKLSPFPHFTLSTRTDGLIYPQLTLPVSDWYVGRSVAQSIESGHNVSTVHALVDFYYNMGALVNLYGHTSSASGLMNVFMKYSLSKPRMWAANSVEIYDWWTLRSNVRVVPAFAKIGKSVIASATISGASDPDTAIELDFPQWTEAGTGIIRVYLDGILAPTDSYRLTKNGVTVRVGAGIIRVEVRVIPYVNYPQDDRPGNAARIN